MSKSSRLALAGLFVLIGAAAAEARGWSRTTMAAGPRAQVATRSISGSCASGSCTRGATSVGPQGGVVTRSGTVTRTAPGQFEAARTTTGPRGGSVTRSGTVTLN